MNRSLYYIYIPYPALTGFGQFAVGNTHYIYNYTYRIRISSLDRFWAVRIRKLRNGNVCGRFTFARSAGHSARRHTNGRIYIYIYIVTKIALTPPGGGSLTLAPITLAAHAHRGLITIPDAADHIGATSIQQCYKQQKKDYVVYTPVAKHAVSYMNAKCTYGSLLTNTVYTKLSRVFLCLA